MKTIDFATQHCVKVVALHESINVSNNIFTDIAFRVSTRRESTFSRRLARKYRQALSKVCRSAAIVVKKQKTTKRKDAGEAVVVCVDLDDTINAKQNTFEDIAKAIYQRSIGVLKAQVWAGQDDDTKAQDDVRNGDLKKKRRRRFRICSAMKRLFS